MKKLQAERGERLGGRPPYGYKKANRESKKLVPDDEAAAVVQKIFSLCASGKGPNQIARILREKKVLTPSNYYYRNHEKSHAKLDLTRPYAWSSSGFRSSFQRVPAHPPLCVEQQHRHGDP